MQKILVIGCSGSGKSCFARGLRDATGLPLVYLDMLWHKADKTTVTREEFDTALEQALAGERWIIDGNYARTLERRLQCCDTVFLFDLPTELCLQGARARIGTKREDLPWVEEEFDPEFQAWIERFAANRLPQIYQLLDACRDRVNVVVFHDRAEADAYLRRLSGAC